MRTIEIVNVIPNDHSNETSDDTEPSIAVNPNNPCEMVITAFTPPDNGRANRPVYFSEDGGETWSLNFDVPGGVRGDQTVSFATTSNALYMAALREGTAELNAIRIADPAMGANNPVFDIRDKIDQPWVQAISVVGGPDNGKDRIYIGYYDSSNSATNPVAAIDFCLDALADQPVFTKVQLERRKVLFDNATIRPVVHRDGTVYVGYVSSLSESGRNGHTTTSEIVVARDDNWGRNNFTDLTDPSDGKAGRLVATGVLIDIVRLLGGNRAGNDLSIAVDPTNSDIVYIVWSDTTGPNYTLRARRSLDRGVNWSADLITVDNATLESLAINSRGTVGLLYLQSVPTQAEWETHFRSTDNGTTWGDTVLARTDTSSGSFIGDFTRMVAVGPNFYGVFPAVNSPDPVHFFPNGGGTFRFQRNISGTAPALLGTDGKTVITQSVDPFFFKVVEVSTGVVQGHVRDTAGNAIADASVLVGSTQVSTDSEGFYTVTVDAGVYDVLAVQSGFVPVHARVSICALGTTPKDFTLEQGIAFIVMGQVTDTKENPIPGATVRLIEIDAGVPGILDTTTDSMGFYSITDNPGSYDGRYSITAFASGFESSSVTIEKISIGVPVPPQNLMLPRIGILAGNVTDMNGTPLTEAHVLVGKTPDTFSLSSPTDSTGHYSIMVDPPGAYNAVAVESGFEEGDPVNIAVSLDTITPKDFALVKAMPGNITGVVMDLDTGDPIEGATVEAIVDPPSASQTTETDATGNYTLSNVLSGRRQVRATATGYSGEVQTVKVIAGPQPVIANPFTLVRKRSRRP